eukprot:scaffold48_cov311-Pinguiococcus_pyrenoidosus.AAC.79
MKGDVPLAAQGSVLGANRSSESSSIVLNAAKKRSTSGTLFVLCHTSLPPLPCESQRIQKRRPRSGACRRSLPLQMMPPITTDARQKWTKESRRQKAEGRRQKAEGRRQKHYAPPPAARTAS